MPDTNCRIRQMCESDLGRVRNWRNDPSIRKNMFNTHVISATDHRNWFEVVAKDPNRRVLIYEEGGNSMGVISFTFLSGCVADWGFYNAPEAPAGTGSKLGRAALKFAFCELELHKVCGQVLALNSGSIRFHEKMGFQPEGVLREQHFSDDGYQDVHIFGLLYEEWRALTG